MQPYFFPYIGYFQLIAAVDLFLVYDNIKYTKKGWINRNRMLQNAKDATFSLPLKHASDRLDIAERELADSFDRDNLLQRLEGAYHRAPYFPQTFPLIEQVVRHEASNLFSFLHHSLIRTCAHLGLTTPIRISSQVAVDTGLKGQEKVIALCKALGASTYVNAIGGTKLYSKDAFRDQGIELKFIQAKPFEYPQYGSAFVPWLSIIDVMMFNPPEVVRSRIATGYELS
jgi:hypothetical protein